MLPEISEPDIERVEAALGIQCDTERRLILKHRESVDIRACAGSGKTTLLVAKLALLLEHWDERSCGIAILSHTNVAHREIRSRFTNAPHLSELEQYPHYLGTIQSFINLYLGVPGSIARFASRPVIIDDERFATAAIRAIRHQSYATARGWLRNQHKGDAIVNGLRYELTEAGDLVVQSAGGTLPAPTSPTTQSLVRLKESLFQKGVCRYDDMSAIGHWYAQKHESIVSALARRFPCVLIDETQDTDSRQDAIVELVFGNRSVVQRFGDDRQAIYRGGAVVDVADGFPRAGHLSMNSSKRVSPSIARLAQNVCNGEVELMQGNNDVADHAHTVFLVAPDRVTSVIPAFANHVATELGTELTWRDVKAVGFRREGESLPERVPGILADYCHPYVSLGQHASKTLSSLEEYVCSAIVDMKSSRGSQQARERLLLAACRVLDLQGLQLDGRAYSPHRLVRVLRENDHPFSPDCLRIFCRLLSSGLATWTDGIEGFASDLLASLSNIHPDDWNQQVQDFCTRAGDGDETEELMPDRGDNNPAGIISVPTPHGDIELEVSTIHSVKGETLEAVLVLTTFAHEHDLKKVIEAGYLRGVRPTAAKARQKRLGEHVKRVHVAMTRPRRLVCLAIRDDHISTEHRAEMEALGWSFQTV